MKAKKIVFTGKEQLELVEQTVPDIQPGQLLVETTVSLISTGTELICFTRNFSPGTHWDNWVKYPFEPGYQSVGRVLEVGPGVEGWKPGDRVAARRPHQSHYLLPADQAFIIPEQVSDEEASWMGLGHITQTGVRAAEHRLGDDVAIIGLGPLGQLVAQWARLSGARSVIAIDRWQSRLDLAAKLGSVISFNGDVTEARAVVEKETDGRLADVVYDVTGAAPVFAGAQALARDFGKLLLLGDTGSPEKQHLTPDVLRRGVRIAAVHDSHHRDGIALPGYWTKCRQHEFFLELIAAGRMQTAPLISHRFKPADAANAYRLLMENREQTLGVLFQWK